MSLEKEIYKSPKSSFINFSTVFLMLVVLLTVGLYSYNFYLTGVNKQINDEYIQKQKLVAEKKQQKKLQVYALYTMNKTTIDKFEKYSDIRKYINHLELISSKYNVIFKGFSYSGGAIQTNAYTVSDSKSIDYQKTVKFLKEYKKDKNALFTLEPITGVTTLESNQKFKVNFKIK